MVTDGAKLGLRDGVAVSGATDGIMAGLGDDGV